MKTDFTSPTNHAVLQSSEKDCLQHNTNMKRKLTLAGLAMAALLMAGSVGTCYGGVAFYYNGPYTGPYYGPYGPYDNGSVIITGDSNRAYYGTHHFFGIGFGNDGHHEGSRSRRGSRDSHR